MGIFDAMNMFSDEQDITATAASTNVIDTGHTKDGGPGYPVHVACIVTEAFNTLTSLAVALQTATDAAFTTPVTLQTVSLALAALLAGEEFSFSCLPHGCLRYLRLYYTVTGTDPTEGQISAGLVFDSQLP